MQSSWEAAEDNTVVLCAWQRQELCIHMCLHPGNPTARGASLNNRPRCVTEPLTPLRRAKLKTETHSVTSYEFSLPHSLLRKLSPQSPPHSSAREREDSCEISVRSQEHLQMFKHPSIHQKLADSCQLRILLASYHCNRDSCQGVRQHPPVPQVP